MDGWYTYPYIEREHFFVGLNFYKSFQQSSGFFFFILKLLTLIEHTQK